jgi:hypothetical protein
MYVFANIQVIYYILLSKQPMEDAFNDDSAPLAYSYFCANWLNLWRNKPDVFEFIANSNKSIS